jgi:dTDP-4-dehydrorhamnose reductase
VRVDQAETDVERCFRENVLGPAVLAAACARHQIHLTTFSSDLVFDGRRRQPYVETDEVAPLNIYGKSKAAAERAVRDHHPAALVVRTSAFFGPWDRYNFVTQAVDTLASGAPFTVTSDIIVTPTYVPDLVHACLDLIIDRESGVWHLTNGDPVTWVELASRTALLAGVDTSRLEPQLGADCNYLAPRPRYSALHTERAILLPPLDNAIERFLQLRAEPPELDELIHASDTRQPPGAAQRQVAVSSEDIAHAKHF